MFFHTPLRRVKNHINWRSFWWGLFNTSTTKSDPFLSQIALSSSLSLPPNIAHQLARLVFHSFLTPQKSTEPIDNQLI
jgi:hypothetical protein